MLYISAGLNLFSYSEESTLYHTILTVIDLEDKPFENIGGKEKMCIPAFTTFQ